MTFGTGRNTIDIENPMSRRNLALLHFMGTVAHMLQILARCAWVPEGCGACET